MHICSSTPSWCPPHAQQCSRLPPAVCSSHTTSPMASPGQHSSPKHLKPLAATSHTPHTAGGGRGRGCLRGAGTRGGGWPSSSGLHADGLGRVPVPIRGFPAASAAQPPPAGLPCWGLQRFCLTSSRQASERATPQAAAAASGRAAGACCPGAQTLHAMPSAAFCVPLVRQPRTCDQAAKACCFRCAGSDRPRLIRALLVSGNGVQHCAISDCAC